jgi:hypothetical protein
MSGDYGAAGRSTNTGAFKGPAHRSIRPRRAVRRLRGPTILLVRPSRPAYNHPLQNETWRIETATMPALSFVTYHQIAARKRRERRVESLSLQRVWAHMDRTEGREIFATGGVRIPCSGPVQRAASAFAGIGLLAIRHLLFTYHDGASVCEANPVGDPGGQVRLSGNPEFTGLPETCWCH